MGLTFTAIGTSLPNLFASVLVAKQGLGNMAVSNAFGSNTFNIFVALGFPWFARPLLPPCPPALAFMCEADHTDHSLGAARFIACLVDDSGEHVYKVNSGHIFGTCMILVGVLAMFLFFLGTTKMRLTPFIGTVYIVVCKCGRFFRCLT